MNFARLRMLFLFPTSLALLIPVPAAAKHFAAPSQKSSAPAAKSKVVYVSDFELDADNLQTAQGVGSGTGPTGRTRIIEGPRARRKEEDPAAQAQKLVSEMTRDLIADLQKSGFTAHQLMPGESRPKEGLWLHGVFTEVDEGNRVRRAVIGFGSGAATMDLYVTLTDLSKPNQSLYEIDTKDTSGKKPGAAITMNPYAAAAKFVMEKNATGKVVKKTASQIVDDIVKKLNSGAATSGQ